MRLTATSSGPARPSAKAFHDEVLGAGALPMNVLEQRINDWIAARKAAA